MLIYRIASRQATTVRPPPTIFGREASAKLKLDAHAEAAQVFSFAAKIVATPISQRRTVVKAIQCLHDSNVTFRPVFAPPDDLQGSAIGIMV
jgi:hypothetical protein